MHIEGLPLLSDNYAWVLTPQSGNGCAVVDPSEAGPVIEFLESRDLRLEVILATHHHWDHTGGIAGLLEFFPEAKVFASEIDAKHFAGTTDFIGDGDVFELFAEEVHCLHVPGHTLGAVAFYCPKSKAVFTGDTLFTAGCGRLFEGTPEQLCHSLLKIRELPEDVLVYCGHEYTQKNLNYALHVEPENAAVQARLAEVDNQRAQGRPTVPALLKTECETNPFLRSDDGALQAAKGCSDAVSLFALLRRGRDSF
jgi:hydroxyacylglutathione hydrolase